MGCRREIGEEQGFHCPLSLPLSQPCTWATPCNLPRLQPNPPTLFQPPTQVRTSVTPGGAVSGPQAIADAFAQGDKISATKVTGRVDGWVSCPSRFDLFLTPPSPSLKPKTKTKPKQTNTASVDWARNGDDVALATAFGDSYSVQGDGLAARATSTVQVTGGGWRGWVGGWVGMGDMAGGSLVSSSSPPLPF